MAKHSKAPWTMDERYPFNIYSNDSTGSIVAKCGEFEFVNRSAEETQANMKLITAAPDMLSTLKQLRLNLRIGDSWDRWQMNVALGMIERVIKQAEDEDEDG
jgi:hypothetical protein